MALNIVYSGIQRLGTHLLSSPSSQPPAVREEDADSYFFSKDYIVPRDLAPFILDRVDDAGLAGMKRVNRKWYWTVVKCPRFMDRLVISACINAGKADIETLRLDIPRGWFSDSFSRSHAQWKLAKSTLAIAKVDPRFLETAKVAALEMENPTSRADAVLDIAKVDPRYLEIAKVAAFGVDPIRLAYAIKNVAEEEAKTDIEAAKATALKIVNPQAQAEALEAIAKVEDHGRNEGGRSVVVALKGKPLMEFTAITVAFADMFLPSVNLSSLAHQDLKGAKEKALNLRTRVEQTLGLLVIAEVDPKHDFSDAKYVALKDDPNLGAYWTFRAKVGMGKPDDYGINNLLIEIVNVEARYNLKDAKETALMIKDPYHRVIALAIVAKAAQSHLNSLTH
jgi:hypothetical protein